MSYNYTLIKNIICFIIRDIVLNIKYFVKQQFYRHARIFGVCKSEIFCIIQCFRMFSVPLLYNIQITKQYSGLSVYNSIQEVE